MCAASDSGEAHGLCLWSAVLLLLSAVRESPAGVRRPSRRSRGWPRDAAERPPCPWQRGTQWVGSHSTHVAVRVAVTDVPKGRNYSVLHAENPLRQLSYCKQRVVVWRRGWDSDSVRSFGFCKLRIPHCRRCHGCRESRGTLHAVARWRAWCWANEDRHRLLQVL